MEMDAWQIVRVSEDFRVIALGLPVPKYKGNPLDPPLRSRFQARDIYYLPFKVRAQHSSDQHSSLYCCCSFVKRTKTLFFYVSPKSALSLRIPYEIVLYK